MLDKETEYEARIATLKLERDRALAERDKFREALEEMTNTGHPECDCELKASRALEENR